MADCHKPLEFLVPYRFPQLLPGDRVFADPGDDLGLLLLIASSATFEGLVAHRELAERGVGLEDESRGLRREVLGKSRGLRRQQVADGALRITRQHPALPGAEHVLAIHGEILPERRGFPPQGTLLESFGEFAVQVSRAVWSPGFGLRGFKQHEDQEHDGGERQKQSGDLQDLSAPSGGLRRQAQVQSHVSLLLEP